MNMMPLRETRRAGIDLARNRHERRRFRARGRGGRGAITGGGGGDPGGDTLLAEGTLYNLGGSTVGSGIEFSIGHVFKRGDVPVGGSIKLKTTSDVDITAQMEYESYWDGGANADDTLRYSGFKALLPSNLLSAASIGIRMYASADAPTRTAPASIATVVAAIIATDDYQVRVALSTGADNGTWIGSRDHALGGTLFDASTGYGSNPDRGYRVLSHGPVCTVIEWWSKLYKSPTTSDYHPHLRATGIVRYYHASGRMQESLRAGMPNMFAAQGVTGITTWEDKFPTSVSIYRGAAKLREWLDSDTYPCAIGMAQAPWWLDAHADWDWSDGTARELFWAQDTTYAATAKVFPAFDLTLTETKQTAAAFMPGYPNVWPSDFHQTGDANNDPRVGPVSWATLKAWQSPSDIDARRYERIGLFSLLPAWHINEGTGLRPVKGDPANSYGPYGTAQPTIGRSLLWETPSPTCLLNAGPGTDYQQVGGIWYARYQEGITESSHWPNLWAYGAVANDERAIQSCIDHNLSLQLNRGGIAGWTFGAEYPGWDQTPGEGGFVSSFGNQLRGDGWANKVEHMASMLLRKYEHDHTNLYQERVVAQDKTARECAFVKDLCAFFVALSPTSFPGNFGGLPFVMQGDPGIEEINAPDSLGRQWHRFGGNAIYFNLYMWYGRLMIALSDDVGAADIAAVWNGKSEKFTLAWLANIGLSCNYQWSSFESFPCYYDGDFANTTTDIETIKDALAEITNGGTYSCPSNFAEFGTGSIFDTVQSVVGLADQAGVGSLYDNGTLYDTLQGLRANTRALKYSIQKAA